MPKKLLFISFLLVSTSVIFFLILINEKQVCGQSNTNSCCSCVGNTSQNSNVNSERLLNLKKNGNFNEKVPNKPSNFDYSDTRMVKKQKAISLPKSTSKALPLLKTILEQTAEYDGNNMEFAKYFIIGIGSINYYFREDNESIRNVRIEKQDSNNPEICGRYAMVDLIPIDDELKQIGGGQSDIWRDFNGKWKLLLSDTVLVNREIYPLIMSQEEMNCFGAIVKPFSTIGKP